jgi:hypothetical protein
MYILVIYRLIRRGRLTFITICLIVRTPAFCVSAITYSYKLKRCLCSSFLLCVYFHECHLHVRLNCVQVLVLISICFSFFTGVDCSVTLWYFRVVIGDLQPL